MADVAPGGGQQRAAAARVAAALRAMLARAGATPSALHELLAAAGAAPAGARLPDALVAQLTDRLARGGSIAHDCAALLSTAALLSSVSLREQLMVESVASAAVTAARRHSPLYTDIACSATSVFALLCLAPGGAELCSRRLATRRGWS